MIDAQQAYQNVLSALAAREGRLAEDLVPASHADYGDCFVLPGPAAGLDEQYLIVFAKGHGDATSFPAETRFIIMVECMVGSGDVTNLIERFQVTERPFMREYAKRI